MRVILLLLLLAAMACSTCGASEQQNRAGRVLFVGNSLTYVGNVPAIYSTWRRKTGGRGVRT